MAESKLRQNSEFCSHRGPETPASLEKGLLPESLRTHCHASATAKLSPTDLPVKDVAVQQKQVVAGGGNRTPQLSPTRNLAATLYELLLH